MPYQVCTNDESGLTLTFFTAFTFDSLCIYIGKILKCSSFYNCLVEIIYINIFRSFDQMATMPINSKTKYMYV